jgi:hypothetical protein
MITKKFLKPSLLWWATASFLTMTVVLGLWWKKPYNQLFPAITNSPATSASQVPSMLEKSSHTITNPSDLPATNEDLLTLLQSPGGDLSPLKVQAARDYLKNPKRAETAIEPSAEYFNNITSLLLGQSEYGSELSKILLGVVNDSGQSLLLRNYAMQHFFHCWNREGDFVMREALEQSLKRHTQDAKSPLQGVALLTTARFFEQGKPVKGPNGEKLTPIGGTPAPNPLSISKPTSFTDVEFVATALRVTNDLAATPAARASAFNVLLNMEVRQAIDPARQVLQAAITPDEVRCSALAVLGTFGDLATDRRDLDAIPVQPEDVRKAADFAFSKLFQFSRTKP